MNKTQSRLFAFTVIGVITTLLVITLSPLQTASEQVNFQQSIQYKDAFISKDKYTADSLMKIINEKTFQVGSTMIARQQGTIDINEENRRIENILNN